MAGAAPSPRRGSTLVIAHGGGPTAVINASLAGVLREARVTPGIGRVLAARHGIEGLLCGDFIDLAEISETEISRLVRTPGSAIGSCRYKVTDADHAQILSRLDEVGASIFLYNGGNDSMDTAATLAELAPQISVVGIPKTIDNDLAGTDHSPGFPSAARYIATSTAELALDVQALNIHVAIVEVLGRNAGWLTAAAGLANHLYGIGPAFTLVPEVPVDIDDFLTRVHARWREARGFVVAVGEGAVGPDGRVLVEQTDPSGADQFGHAVPGNVSHYLAELISGRLGIRARSEKPGLIGRASQALVSSVDREEAEAVGRMAVRTAVAGETGVMVAITRQSNTPYRAAYSQTPLRDAANVERTLSSEFFDEDTLSITKSYLEYALPLLGNEHPDYFMLPPAESASSK